MTTGADTEVPLDLPRGLLFAVTGLALLAVLLGGLVLVLQLRPEAAPTTTAERELAAWERAVEQEPASDRAHAGLGAALVELGRATEARVAFEQALEREPTNWVALQQLGILLMTDDPDRAEELLAASAEHAPRTSRALALIPLGDLRLEHGDPAGARTAYEGAIGDLPFVMDGHLGLARALEALGDEDGARAAYERAARFDISDVDGRPGPRENQEEGP